MYFSLKKQAAGSSLDRSVTENVAVQHLGRKIYDIYLSWDKPFFTIAYVERYLNVHRSMINTSKGILINF